MTSKPVVRKTVEIHLKPRARGLSLQQESFYIDEALSKDDRHHAKKDHNADEEQNKNVENRARSQSSIVTSQTVFDTSRDGVVQNGDYDPASVRQKWTELDDKSSRNDTPYRRYSHQPETSSSGFVVGSITRRTPLRRSVGSYHPARVHSAESRDRVSKAVEKTPRTLTREEAQFYARTPLVDSPSDEWYVSGSRPGLVSKTTGPQNDSVVGLLDFSDNPVNDLIFYKEDKPSSPEVNDNSPELPESHTFRFTDDEVSHSRGARPARPQRVSMPAVYPSQQRYRENQGPGIIKPRSQSIDPAGEVGSAPLPGDTAGLRAGDKGPASSADPEKDASLRRRKVGIPSNKPKKRVSFSDDDFTVDSKSSPPQRRRSRGLSVEGDMDLQVDLSALSVSKPRGRRGPRRKYSLTIGLFGHKTDRDSSVESERESLDSPGYNSTTQHKSFSDQSEHEHVDQRHTRSYSSSQASDNETARQLRHRSVSVQKASDSDSAYGGSPTLQQSFYVGDHGTRKTRSSSLQHRAGEYEQDRDFDHRTDQPNTERTYTRRARSLSAQHHRPDDKNTRRISAMEIRKPKVTMVQDPSVSDLDDVFVRPTDYQHSKGRDSVDEDARTNSLERPQRRRSSLGFSKVTQLDIASDDLDETQHRSTDTSRSRHVESQHRDVREHRSTDTSVSRKVETVRLVDRREIADHNNNSNRRSEKTGETNTDYLKELERRREMLEKEQQRMQEEIEMLRQEQQKILQSDSEKAQSAGSVSSESADEVCPPPVTESRRIDPDTLVQLVAAEEKYWKNNMEKKRGSEGSDREESHGKEERYWEKKLQKIKREKSRGSQDELSKVTVRRDKRRASDTPHATMNEEWYKTLPRKTPSRRRSQPVDMQAESMRAEEEFMAQEAERFMRKKMREQSKLHVEPNIVITNTPLNKSQPQIPKQNPQNSARIAQKPPLNPQHRQRETSSSHSKLLNGGLHIPRADHFMARCSLCSEPVDRDICMHVPELNKYWHTTCFRCAVCQAQLSNGKSEAEIKVYKSKILCSNCDVTEDARGSLLCSQI